MLFRLPRVIAAIKAGEPIYVAEGEKDVIALERAGVTATCNSGGAGKWRPEHTEALRGAEVVVVADQDDPGRKHADQVAAALNGVARSVRVVEPIEGKDASDHLAAGYGLDEFKPMGASSRRPITRASTITRTRLRWTWRGRLALGYLAVWCGAGDIGKSMFAAWVIRQLAGGELEGEFYGEPQTTLIICTEDGRDDMWLPRLEAVGADLDRVEFLDYPRGWNLRDGISWITRAITDTQTPLIFIDALMSHMPEARGSENTRSPTFVRQALAPLGDLAKERKVTPLFGLHPRKAGGETFADVVQESGVFTQLPRLGLLFGYHPDDVELPRDQQRRVILRGKGNVGRDPGALSFRIAEKFLEWDDDPEGKADGVGYITDVQPCHVTERQLLTTKPQASDRPPSKVEQAEQLIDMALRDGGWHLAAPIRSRLAELGLDGAATVQVAKSASRLDVESARQRGVPNGPWYWRIRNSSNSDGPPDSSPSRAKPVEQQILPLENPPDPNKDGLNQRIARFERNGIGGVEESKNRRIGTENARESESDPFLDEVVRRHGQGER